MISFVNQRGTILIVTLWILVILTVFALALGQRASLEVKLAGYARDKLRASELARAAMERVIYEKLNDPEQKVDALNEPWSNNEVFKDFKLGDENFSGTLTASYEINETMLYGMEDEESKINLNLASPLVLEKLLENYEDKGTIAGSIIAWRSLEQNDGSGDYFKNENFKSITELLLVPGMTPEILYGEDKNDDGKISPEEEGIAQYLTVFSEGKVNINTAPPTVLSALINEPDLVNKIVAYRKGVDEKIGTEDDHTFFIAVNKFGVDSSWYNSYGTDADLAKLNDLVSQDKRFVNSHIYTIHTQAEVNKVKSSLTATIKIDPANPAQITYLFWQKN